MRTMPRAAEPGGDEIAAIASDADAVSTQFAGSGISASGFELLVCFTL